MKTALCLGGVLVFALASTFAATTDSPDPNTQAKPLTAADQSNAPGDVNITAKIRRDVMQDDRLSANAKNVKIITSGGKVTLAGSLNNAAEKTIISEHAEKAVGKANVMDQTTVK
jgi:osmotically-inducible protein OsmY